MRCWMLGGLIAVLASGCGGEDAPAVDAQPAPADAAGLATTCTGDCATLDLTASFGATTRAFARAYYGVTSAAGGDTLHVEAYAGGADGCPTKASPTPDYTLIIDGADDPVDLTVTTGAGSVLDFVGDLLGGPLGAAATSVTLTPVARTADVVAFTAALTFDGGTVAGHLVASHCASLDEPS
ncbi:MAG: hypothetical protein R2939_01615 [Kofleriaceae bacterium]